MRILASVVTSRALETWPAASSPSGRTKCVSARPSWRARRFIIETKRCSLPRPTCCASAHAASFALWMSAASSKSRTVSCSPARSGTLDSPTAAASGEIVTSSVGLASSRVRRTVMSLVRLATGTRRAGFWASSTSPVRPSSTMYARASTLGPAAKAAGARASTAARTSSVRGRGTIRESTGAPSAPSSNTAELLGREHQARGRTRPRKASLAMPLEGHGGFAAVTAPCLQPWQGRGWALAPRDRGPEAGTKASLAMPTMGGRAGFAGTAVLYCWMGHLVDGQQILRERGQDLGLAVADDDEVFDANPAEPGDVDARLDGDDIPGGER